MILAHSLLWEKGRLPKPEQHSHLLPPCFPSERPIQAGACLVGGAEEVTAWSDMVKAKWRMYFSRKVSKEGKYLEY